MLVHASVFIFCFVCFSMCVRDYQSIEAMHTIHSNLENNFVFSQARNARTQGDVYEYFDSFIRMTYKMSNAIIDATTFDTIGPRECIHGKHVCQSSIWKLFLDNNNVSHEHGHQVADKCTDTPCTLVFNKRTFTEHAPPQLLFSEAEFTGSTITFLTPLVIQKHGQWVECSRMGKFYNKEINKTKFNYQYDFQQRDGSEAKFEIRYAGWQMGASVGANCIDRKQRYANKIHKYWRLGGHRRRRPTAPGQHESLAADSVKLAAQPQHSIEGEEGNLSKKSVEALLETGSKEAYEILRDQKFKTGKFLGSDARMHAWDLYAWAHAQTRARARARAQIRAQIRAFKCSSTCGCMVRWSNGHTNACTRSHTQVCRRKGHLQIHLDYERTQGHRFSRCSHE